MANILIDNVAFSGKNATSAVEVYNYTVLKSSYYQFRVRATNAAGNGNYSVYLTRQLGGAGTIFPLEPKTTVPAAAGESAFGLCTLSMFFKINDKVGINVAGLAGDNSLNGNVDVIEDDALVPTTVGQNATNVDANGRVDIGAWLGVVPAVLTASGYIQSMLLRWLTDNAAGTPSALSANLVQVADSAGVTTLLGRISATLFSGITSLANWLRLMARKDAALAADAVAAQAEINANLGSGAGAMTNTTDSEEAIRDQVNTLAPGAPINLTVDETDIVVNP